MTHETTPCARGCEIPGAHSIEHPSGSACPGCKKRTAMRGTTVCQHCADLFATALRDLTTAWPDLRTGVARDRSTRFGTGAVQSSRIAEVGDYWRPAVTQIIADITSWIAFAATAITDPPSSMRRIDLQTMAPQAALAALNYYARPILIGNPPVAEALVGEALRLRGRAHRALETNYVRRVPLTSSAAHCLAEVEHDDPNADDGVRTEQCGGDLAAILQPADAGGQSAILCSRFPQEHRIAPGQWGELADELEALTS